MTQSEVVLRGPSVAAKPTCDRDTPAERALHEAGVIDHIPELLKIASELFPGEVSYSIESDAELPDEHYVVFDVSSADSYAELSKREFEWYQRAFALLGTCSDKVRLFVGVRP